MVVFSTCTIDNTRVTEVVELFRRCTTPYIPITSFLVKSDYNKLYNAFYGSMASILDEAEQSGIKRNEACHNLVFMAGFNTYGGLKTLLPALIKWVGLAGEKLHRELCDEIRTIVRAEGDFN